MQPNAATFPYAAEPWFLGEITDVSGDAHGFKEQWLDDTAAVVDMFGGRANDVTLDPAYAVAGGPFAVGDMVFVRSARGAAGLLWELATLPAASDRGFWVQITGGTDAGGYSGKRVHRTSGATWADATEPNPLTWTTAIWRAPSVSATSIPAIPSGQVVRCWPSPADPTRLETDGVGGRQAAAGTVGPYVVSGTTMTFDTSGSTATFNEDCTITLNIVIVATVHETTGSQTLTVTARDCTVSLPGPA